jgi:hypothetical protein
MDVNETTARYGSKLIEKYSFFLNFKTETFLFDFTFFPPSVTQMNSTRQHVLANTSDVVQHVLQFVDPSSRFQLGRVSKTWYKAMSNTRKRDFDIIRSNQNNINLLRRSRWMVTIMYLLVGILLHFICYKIIQENARLNQYIVDFSTPVLFIDADGFGIDFYNDECRYLNKSWFHQRLRIGEKYLYLHSLWDQSETTAKYGTLKQLFWLFFTWIFTLSGMFLHIVAVYNTETFPIRHFLFPLQNWYFRLNPYFLLPAKRKRLLQLAMAFSVFSFPFYLTGPFFFSRHLPVDEMFSVTEEFLLVLISFFFIYGLWASLILLTVSLFVLMEDDFDEILSANSEFHVYLDHRPFFTRSQPNDIYVVTALNLSSFSSSFLSPHTGRLEVHLHKNFSSIQRFMEPVKPTKNLFFMRLCFAPEFDPKGWSFRKPFRLGFSLK